MEPEQNGRSWEINAFFWCVLLLYESEDKALSNKTKQNLNKQNLGQHYGSKKPINLWQECYTVSIRMPFNINLYIEANSSSHLNLCSLNTVSSEGTTSLQARGSAL